MLKASSRYIGPEGPASSSGENTDMSDRFREQVAFISNALNAVPAGTLLVVLLEPYHHENEEAI